MIRLAHSDFFITLQVIPIQPQTTHSIGDLFHCVCAYLLWTQLKQDFNGKAI